GHSAGRSRTAERIKDDLSAELVDRSERVHPDQAGRQFLRKWRRVIAVAFHIFWIDEPNLLSKIDPLLLQQCVRLFHWLVISWRLSRFHIHVDELNRIVFQNIARVGIAAE